MSLGDFIRKQFLDVLQWTEGETGVLSYRIPMQDMEIQYGSELTVREGQAALFVNEGVTADVFAPGRHQLLTSTLPILTNLKAWAFGFESPFKSDVYFVSTRSQLGLRWGTQQPITVRDKEFGAVRLRGFGTFSFHIFDPKVFFSQVVGTREVVRVSDLEPQLRATVIAHVADGFANSNVPFLDMAANTLLLGQRVRDAVAPAFAALGLGLDSFLVESISLPEELQQRLDAKSGMAILGDLDQYAKLQAAEALKAAASNPSGAAGAGLGLAGGLVMGQQLGAQLARPGQPAAPSQPTTAVDTKFCHACGKAIPRLAKFCAECGAAQA